MNCGALISRQNLSATLVFKFAANDMYMKRSGMRANTYQTVRMMARVEHYQNSNNPLCFIYRVSHINLLLIKYFKK